MSYAVPPPPPEGGLRQLRQEIVSGQLPAGTVIKDAEVAARLGVSITPIREAIAQLAAEGLIELAPNPPRRGTGGTQKKGLQLIDVMAVLACAGFEWGAPNLTEDHLAKMRVRLDEFVDALRREDVVTAGASGADFSTIVISASGNRELQTHVDLVVARTLRLLALTADSDVWPIWIHGYRETLELLERGKRDAAVERYRRIYTEYRARVETLLFDEEAQPAR